MKKVLAVILGTFLTANLFAKPFSNNQAKLANPAYLGYWSNLNTNNAGTVANPTITQTVQAGYNTISIAFGVIQGTQVSLYDNNWNNQGYGVDQNSAGFVADIDAAHQLGATVLLSFGGGSSSNFSWNPDPNNPSGAADSIISFLSANHLDGIDFDLEDGMNVDQTYLISFISELRKQSQANPNEFPRGFFITGAPQLFTDAQWCLSRQNSVLQWSGCHPLDELLPESACNGSVCFDGLSVQDYNNDPYQQQLGDAFNQVKDQLSSNGNNGATQILLGLPINSNSGQGYMDPSQVKAAIAKITDPQFGGMMVWTASQDFTDNQNQIPWGYITTLKNSSAQK